MSLPIENGGLVAVLDWENACLGDPGDGPRDATVLQTGVAEVIESHVRLRGRTPRSVRNPRTSPCVLYAVVGEVSLRVANKNSMVLSAKTPSGDVYSACFEEGPGFAMEGRNDTSDPSGCSNGWLNAP